VLYQKGTHQSSNGTSSRANIVPVQAKREHSKTLVTRGTTEDAGNPWAITFSETENADTSERPEISSQSVKSAISELNVRSTHGAMYSGNHSQTKMPMNVSQKNLTRFFWRKIFLPRCRASKS
jgi:hypothetical protein